VGRKKKKDNSDSLHPCPLQSSNSQNTAFSPYIYRGFSIGNPPTLSWISKLGVALLNDGQGGDFGGSRTCQG